MGNTQSAGEEHNLQWKIGDDLGNKFEDKIYYFLLSELKEYLNTSVGLRQTDRINDCGKDIVIESLRDSLSIFNISFPKRNREKSTIYIECKSTDSKILRREKFIPSIEKGKKDHVDYYVLLTNAKINAVDYYEADELLRNEGTEFILIDQYLLAKAIKYKYPDLFGDIPLYNGSEDFYVTYQVYPDSKENNKYDIYFNFRNYGQQTHLYEISLITNVNWNTVERSVSFTIDPNKAYAKKISVECGCENDYKTLLFKIVYGSSESFVSITGINIRESFTPNFIGKERNEIVTSMVTSIINPRTQKLYCLWGDAGIGKTRIIHEVSAKIKDSLFDYFECSVKNDNLKVVDEIRTFLLKNKYISEFDAKKCGNNLYNIISNTRKMLKTAVIFIDDFHNCGQALIEQVKKLYKHSNPVILIICGRTDYTEGDTEYYSFVHWSFTTLIQEKYVWDVKPLRDDETECLIKSMINGIPQEAVKTICKKSGNNPLYIVQFIEYLLDEKIAHIVNRNTIGIVDIAKFKARDSIPDAINEIYEKRICNLIQCANEKNIDYLEFLFVLAVFNGQLSISTAKKSFDTNNEKADFLQIRKFIVQKNNKYEFYHESILLYVQNMLKKNKKYRVGIAKYLLSFQSEALSNLPHFTKGRLYLWNGDNNKALKVFKPIVDDISQTDNISNIEIDTGIYEYLDDILELFRDNEQYRELIKKIIQIKIYIILHHFVPMNAVKECNSCLNYISKSQNLKDDVKLTYTILSQKAHSLLNSGMNLDGELILKELQAKWLLAKEFFDYQTEFDMMDRLCAVYIKFNCHEIAADYSSLELLTAKNSNNYALEAIAYRTRSKLFYLNNKIECYKSLDAVDKCLKKSPSFRIEVNNNIYRAIVDLTYDTSKNYDKIIDNIKALVSITLQHNLNRGIIQSHMVLSAAYLKRGNHEDIVLAKKIATTAIDYSIRLGIPSYLWQLYNILGIIDTRLKQNTNTIKQDFETAFDILDKQNLLYIGKGELCFSNILAISNIGIFLSKHSFQKYFNQKMSMITYSEISVTDMAIEHKNQGFTKDELIVLYEKATNKELLFSHSKPAKLLRDDKTKYFIALT